MEGPQAGAPSTARRLVALETRFLWPFAFDHDGLDDVVRAVEAWRLPGFEEAWGPCERYPASYVDELPGQVRDYLFGLERASACSYRRLDPTLVQRLLAHVVSITSEGTLPIRAAGHGVELFLTPHGVGALSVTLAPRDRALPADAAGFVYRLAQTRAGTAARLRVPHPSDDPATLARIPASELARVEPPPAQDAPIEARVGRRGGEFRLEELARLLLDPIERSAGTASARARFSDFPRAYTVARWDASVDFARDEVRDAMSPVLSGLAQIEEPQHAGAVPGVVAVPNALLNRRHWAAVSALGSAHLVADQTPPAGASEHPYDGQRLPRVRDKYFVAFLVAWLQRLTLERSSQDATAALLEPEPGLALAPVRDRLLRFAVLGRFAQVSHRPAVQRYYEIALDGLRVPAAVEAARTSVADLDGAQSRERAEALSLRTAATLEATRALQADQRSSAHASAKSLAALVRLQSMVEWIEVFLVSVYAAHLWHMAAPHAFTWKGLDVGVLVAAIVGGGTALAFLRPWRHRSSHSDAAPPGPSRTRDGAR